MCNEGSFPIECMLHLQKYASPSRPKFTNPRRPDFVHAQSTAAKFERGKESQCALRRWPSPTSARLRLPTGRHSLLTLSAPLAGCPLHAELTFHEDSGPMRRYSPNAPISALHDVAPTARSCAVAMLTRKWGWHAERLGSAAPIGQDWAGGEHASRAVAARCHKLLRIKLTTLRIDVRRRRLWHGMAHVRRHRGICGRAGTGI